MTSEELRAFIEMQDFSTREKMLARQEAMVKELGQNPRKSRHWTAQTADALDGITKAYTMYKTGQDREKMGLEKQEWIRNQGPRNSAAYGESDPSNFQMGMNTIGKAPQFPMYRPDDPDSPWYVPSQ